MTRVESITPYGNDGDVRRKSEQVREMFDSIAPSYDIMNRMMTFGIDRLWRNRCVRMVSDLQPNDVLDLAAGTGDLTIAIAKKIPTASVTGADLSEGMIEVGRKKIESASLQQRVALQVADALNLPFADNSFDAITIAFGVRNFQNLKRGYAEMLRVLRPGGTVVVLELTPPAAKTVKPFYRFYTRCIIPVVGRMVSKDKRAYTYLPESIAAVPARQNMTEIMELVGFTEAAWKSLTLGVATIYSAKKPIAMHNAQCTIHNA